MTYRDRNNVTVSRTDSYAVSNNRATYDMLTYNLVPTYPSRTPIFVSIWRQKSFVSSRNSVVFQLQMNKNCYVTVDGPPNPFTTSTVMKVDY